MEVGAGGEDVAVHGPVVVFAEGEAVGGVVVPRGSEGNEVGGINEGNVVAGRQADAQSTSGALVVVDVEDQAAEGRTAAIFQRVIGDAEVGLLNVDFGGLMLDLGEIREVAGEKCFAEALAGGGKRGEVLEPIGEPGEDLADLVDERRGPERQASGFLLDPGVPKTLGLQVEEGIFRRVLVVVFADEQEAGGKAVAEFAGPRNALGSRKAFVDQIQRGQQQQRLVRPLMRRTPIHHRRRADVEVVKPFNTYIQSHDS